MSTFPLASLPGIAATFAAGLVYGWVFQRSRSIAAPWLAHTLSMILFLALGAASYLQTAP